MTRCTRKIKWTLPHSLIFVSNEGEHVRNRYTGKVSDARAGKEPALAISAYSSKDRQRHVEEPPKSQLRTEFERDRARILHSSALRRLSAKTQVMGPVNSDFARNRLTHSLEVAQVGRTLGRELGCDPDVVDAACLSHDIGHPPFGHNGERALNQVAGECGGFEGNAQTFRILTRLEPKVIGPAGQPAGVNLTRASLDAVLKYPWQRGQGPDRQKSERKYCVYSDDVAAFDWVRQGAPAGKRCLEAQIMDLSDDIAYSVHDVEDAIAMGKAKLSELYNYDVQQKIFDCTRTWYGNKISEDSLSSALDRLLGANFWLRDFNWTYHDEAALKDLTSELIGRFCGAAHDATREAAGQGPLTRYATDLVVPAETTAEILVLKGIAVYYVMAPREMEPVYLNQRTTLFDLVDALLEGGPSLLERPFADAWRRSGNDAERLRVVIDQVASLTDISANQWHGRICGMLSGI